MQVFQKRESFEALFKLREKQSLNYWLNYVLLRFTGYQIGHWFTFNAVVLFGGISSITALIIARTLAHYNVLSGSFSSRRWWADDAELLFWLVASYCMGITVWNFAIIPHYILRQLENIPFDLDPSVDKLRHTKVFDQIGLYAGLGVFALLICIFILSALPLLVWEFEEPEWVVFWAQLVLVFCYAFVIIRFQGRGHSDVGEWPAMMAALLIGAYLFFKLFVAIHIINLVGETRTTKQLIEISVFLALSAYLLRLLRKLLYSGEIKKIREEAKETALKLLSSKSKHLRQRMQQFDELGALQDIVTQKLSIGIELQIVSHDLDGVESISVDSQFYQSLKRLPTASFILGLASLLLGILNFVHHF